ncbi:MAG: hypothetical protein QOG64_1212 [Acidimicrobiaceae bacterium]|nr:hypothetical protein [Acidimicrobiaceae bacterium]
MGHASEPTFLVIHALRLKGFALPEAVAATTTVAEADVERTLEAAAADGLVQKREGRISGWSLTAAGRERHAKLLAEEAAASGCRDAVDASYRRFLEINGELLAVCTDWQMRPGPDGQPVLNDHADADYDGGVIARLRGIDDSVQPVCADLAGILERFGDYGRRLGHAIARVEAGDLDYATKPMIDSYHTVWFELHEDLLATLGIERSKEGAQ